MKTYKIFGFEINIDFHFSIFKVKRMSFDIPEWADDTHVREGKIGDWGTSDGKTKIVYYKGSKMFEIDLPEAKSYKGVSITPLYNKERTDFNKDRKVIVDLYY